jgi:ABC-type multidrug transport system ATPase subunit
METEYLIQEALDVVMRGRTTFVVASRLRTVKRADEILVLDRGRIVERGTHERLLRAGGLYRGLYDVQLREQEEFEVQRAALRADSTEASTRVLAGRRDGLAVEAPARPDSSDGEWPLPIMSAEERTALQDEMSRYRAERVNRSGQPNQSNQPNQPGQSNQSGQEGTR